MTTKTTAPKRKKAYPIKKIQVESWMEAEDLVDPESSNVVRVRRHKSITEKFPGHVIELWLDDPNESELKLMCRVTDAPDPRKRKQ